MPAFMAVCWACLFRYAQVSKNVYEHRKTRRVNQMFRYLSILLSPLLRYLQQNARARKWADKLFRVFPGLKSFLIKVLYGRDALFPHYRSLTMGLQEQRIYEELTRRLEAE